MERSVRRCRSVDVDRRRQDRCPTRSILNSSKPLISNDHPMIADCHRQNPTRSIRFSQESTQSRPCSTENRSTSPEFAVQMFRWPFAKYQATTTTSSTSREGESLMTAECLQHWRRIQQLTAICTRRKTELIEAQKRYRNLRDENTGIVNRSVNIERP